MQHFRATGDEILRRWREVEHNEARFPEIARDVLAQAELHRRIGLDDVADWVLGADRLPPARVSKT